MLFGAAQSVFSMISPSLCSLLRDTLLIKELSSLSFASRACWKLSETVHEGVRWAGEVVSTGEQRKALAFVEKQRHSEKIGKMGNNYLLQHRTMSWLSPSLSYRHYSLGSILVHKTLKIKKTAVEIQRSFALPSCHFVTPHLASLFLLCSYL